MAPAQTGKVNILLVDDQPGKLMSYEVILGELNENLLKASSATEALQVLLKSDVAVLLVDVCMPDLDGFELAALIRQHPRFEKTAIIFISAIHLSEGDSLKGYQLGGVDYVPVPVVPDVLRAKVRVFVDLYRKSLQLEQMNSELERRVAERTEALEASIKRQELLAREVDHRAKNALAVVQSIVRLTKAHDVEAFCKAVHGRIRAVAGAHTLLAETRWMGADIERLVAEELAPYQDGDRVTASGPLAVLRPEVAQAVAIALHELATNAAKYGALSEQRGRLTISWATHGDGIQIIWDETGGPDVSAPTRTGFGAKVIKASVAAQLGGEVDFEWRRKGLRCRLMIPQALLEGPHAPAQERARDEHHGPRSAVDLAGARVMLVEDEALISMMMVELLTQQGAIVVGPFSKLAAAEACEQAFDVALLDVNLAGEPIYPLALALEARNVPFVFVTGYDESIIDDRFSTHSVLQKPIEPDALADALAAAIARAGPVGVLKSVGA